MTSRSEEISRSSSRSAIDAPGHRSKRRARKPAPYVLIAPAATLFAAVLGVPLVQVIRMAFSTVSATGVAAGFAGLANFRSLFRDPVLPTIAVNTAIWTICVLLPGTAFSFLTAVALNAKFRGRAIARAIIFVPWSICFVFVSIIWRLALDPYIGYLNSLLSTITGRSISVAWLGSPDTAMASVVWVGITLTIPFTTIVLLAGLQAVSPELVEAARIDGAGPLRIMISVILPLLRPVLAVVTLVNLLTIFNSFPIIWTMTQGGPAHGTATYATYLYQLAFADQDFGEAAALSVVGFVLLLTASLLYAHRNVRELL